MPQPLSKEFKEYSTGERVRQLRAAYGDDHPEVQAAAKEFGSLDALEEKRVTYLLDTEGPNNTDVVEYAKMEGHEDFKAEVAKRHEAIAPPKEEAATGGENITRVDNQEHGTPKVLDVNKASAVEDSSSET